MKRKGNGLHWVYKSFNISIHSAESFHGLQHCKERPQTGLGWGFCSSGTGEQWNFFDKKLGAYREEAGCSSVFVCFLGLLWTGSSTLCWEQHCLGPLQHAPAKEACSPRKGRQMIPNGPDSVVKELWGLLCQALGSSQSDLPHGHSPLTHKKLEAAAPER